VINSLRWSEWELTERGRVVIARADETQCAKERDQLAGGALIHALALSQRIQMVKHLEETSARLVDRADNRSPLTRQKLQQTDALETRRTVQTTAEKNP